MVKNPSCFFWGGHSCLDLEKRKISDCSWYEADRYIYEKKKRYMERRRKVLMLCLAQPSSPYARYMLKFD